MRPLPEPRHSRRARRLTVRGVTPPAPPLGTACQAIRSGSRDHRCPPYSRRPQPEGDARVPPAARGLLRTAAHAMATPRRRPSVRLSVISRVSGSTRPPAGHGAASRSRHESGRFDVHHVHPWTQKRTCSLRRARALAARRAEREESDATADEAEPHGAVVVAQRVLHA